MGTLLFLFTSASAYNYFQFIYSERFLTFLLALYAYHYSKYLDSGQLHNGRLALLSALFIPILQRHRRAAGRGPRRHHDRRGQPRRHAQTPEMGIGPALPVDEGLCPGDGHRQPGTLFSGVVCVSQCTSQPCC